MKSHASELLSLAICVYKDAIAKCSAQQPDLRDIKTMTSRVEHEGYSFLTITLPTLGKDLERSLEIGKIDSTFFRSFRKNGTIPAFLQGMFSLVFDGRTGELLNDADPVAIESIRQVAYTFKKLKMPCSTQRVLGALDAFLKCEHSFEQALDSCDVAVFSNTANVIWSDIFSDTNVFGADILPKHGPGATADRISGNQKYVFSSWYERLEPYFPLFHYAFSSESAYGSSEFELVTVVSDDNELPVRVIAVPKTLKTPRIIACEPVCMQYTQQALSRHIISCIEKSPITGGHINFTDQTVNKRLAMSSSISQDLSTLDLESASDRVPLEHALRMFNCNPELRDAINACRSRRAILPTGQLVDLKKFASMGSALCFPVEAMYFYTICIIALLAKHELSLTFLNYRKVAKNVFVYGDDIIVPTNCADIVTSYLQKYYCKVSIHKSFSLGNFRESCGMDAFKGVEVTPTYLRELPPRNKRDTSALISWVKTSNLFYRKGCWLTSDHMIKTCERLLGALPIVGEQCAGLGKVSYQNGVSYQRWGKKLHQPEVLAFVPTPIYQRDKLDGYPALTKCLLSMETRVANEPTFESKHLVRSARHGVVTLKRRWTRPY